MVIPSATTPRLLPRLITPLWATGSRDKGFSVKRLGTDAPSLTVPASFLIGFIRALVILIVGEIPHGVLLSVKPPP